MLKVKVNKVGLFAKRFERLMSGDFSQPSAIAANIVVQDLIVHVASQQQIDDSGALAANDPKTIARKQKQGKAGLSLIDDGRLLAASTYVKTVERTGAAISRSTSVQTSRGAKDYDNPGGKGFWWLNPNPPKYNWWGISPTAVKKMMEGWVKYLRSILYMKG